MIRKSAEEVFRGIAALQRRDLVQQRGVWRAVLPPAIANRLAARGLEGISFETVRGNHIYGGWKRLRKSFLLKLADLHDNKVAVRIVNEWLEEGGLLGNAASLGAVEMAVFQNIAPVDPEAVLTMLEGVAPQSLSRGEPFARIVRLIAYEPRLFNRCVD